VPDTLPRRPRLVARALHHPVRATLRKHICAAAEPVPLSDLAQVFDLALAALRYHAQVLVACGLAKLEGGARLAAIEK